MHDFFGIIRDTIIFKAKPTAEFPKPTRSVLKALRQPENLDPDDPEYEKELDLNAKARAFLKNIALDPDLILNMHKLNRDRNYNTHYTNFRINKQKHLSAKENQNALKEIKLELQNITPAHNAYKVKTGAITLIDSFIVK